MTDDTLFLAGYEEYATPRQLEFIEAVREHGSQRAAARSLGINPSTVDKAVARVRFNAAKHGYAPEHDWVHRTPKGHVVKGVSTYYGEDPETGEVRAKGQWVKTRTEDIERKDLWMEFAEEVSGRVPAVPVVPQPCPEDDPFLGFIEDKLLTVYPMGDPHVGMYAWHEECGEDFDVEIASADLLSAASALVDKSPPSATAIILNLGDFYHADTVDNMTRRGGNQLDVDTRWPRVLRAGARLMCDLIDLALRKHSKVVVRNVIGNHDDHSSIALSCIMDARYHDEPRVTVDCSPAQYWYYRHGKVLIGSTHGDKTKTTSLPLIMAHDRPEDWGQTEHRYWYTGHVHHKNVVEVGSVLCESFRTLAARDAYTAGAGYRSGRDMHAIVLDQEYGETDRYRVDIRLARARRQT